jgi:hypothetical protein
VAPSSSWHRVRWSTARPGFTPRKCHIVAQQVGNSEFGERGCNWRGSDVGVWVCGVRRPKGAGRRGRRCGQRGRGQCGSTAGGPEAARLHIGRAGWLGGATGCRREFAQGRRQPSPEESGGRAARHWKNSSAGMLQTTTGQTLTDSNAAQRISAYLLRPTPQGEEALFASWRWPQSRLRKAKSGNQLAVIGALWFGALERPPCRTRMVPAGDAAAVAHATSGEAASART